MIFFLPPGYVFLHMKSFDIIFEFGFSAKAFASGVFDFLMGEYSNLEGFRILGAYFGFLIFPCC